MSEIFHTLADSAPQVETTTEVPVQHPHQEQAGLVEGFTYVLLPTLAFCALVKFIRSRIPEERTSHQK